MSNLLTAVSKPDDGQRNFPKHVEFYCKNKFEKLVHLVGFIIRIYHDARSPECQIPHNKHIQNCLCTKLPMLPTFNLFEVLHFILNQIPSATQ